MTMHGCFDVVKAALNTVTMWGCCDTRPIARHSRSKLRRSRSSARPKLSTFRATRRLKFALAGAEHVAEPAPADRLELVEPVDPDGRHGGVGGAGHRCRQGGSGERIGDRDAAVAGTGPHRITARRSLAYGRLAPRVMRSGVVGGRASQQRCVGRVAARPAPASRGATDERHEGGRRVDDDDGRTHVSRRTRRSIAGSVLVVLGLVIGAVVAHGAAGRGPRAVEGRDQRRWGLAAEARRGLRRPRQPGRRRGHRRRQRRRSRLRLRRRPGAGDHRRPRPHDRRRQRRRRQRRAGRQPGRRARGGQDVAVHAVDGGALIVDRVVDGRLEADREAAAVGRLDRRGRAARHRRGPRPRRPRRPTATPCIADEAAGNVVFLAPRRRRPTPARRSS